MAKKEGELYFELTTPVQELFGKLTSHCATLEKLKQLMMMKQLLNALSQAVRQMQSRVRIGRRGSWLEGSPGDTMRSQLWDSWSFFKGL